MKRFGHDACVSHSMEFAVSSRREPVCFQLASLPRTQAAHWAIDLCFHIKRRCAVRPIAQCGLPVVVESQMRTIGPENNGSLSRIRLVLFVLKTLDHRIATASIDDSQPTIGRIHPKLGR